MCFLVNIYKNWIRRKHYKAWTHAYTFLITACVFHINVIIVFFQSRIFDILKFFPSAYQWILDITIPDPILGITFGDPIVNGFHFSSSEKIIRLTNKKDLTLKVLNAFSCLSLWFINPIDNYWASTMCSNIKHFKLHKIMLYLSKSPINTLK